MSDFPSLKQIFETFEYDCGKGILWRRSDPYHERRAGFIQRDGKRQVKMDLEGHLAADLIWVLQTGEPPVGNIVFINGDLDNTRMSNMRDDAYPPARR